MRPPTEPPAQHRPDEVEQALLGRCRAGDQGAFQALLRPHLPALLGLARRCCRDQHWAEDLVQETLVRAFRGLANFRGDAALRTWLFTILVRLRDLTRSFALNPDQSSTRKHHAAIRCAATANPFHFANLATEVDNALVEVTFNI